MDLTFKTLRAVNLARCEQAFHPLDSWSATDWACAMGGECGEALNLIKKLRRGELITREEIGKELADVVIYADLLATRLGINLGEAVIQKFNEVSDRVGSDIVLPAPTAEAPPPYCADFMAGEWIPAVKALDGDHFDDDEMIYYRSVHRPDRWNMDNWEEFRNNLPLDYHETLEVWSNPLPEPPAVEQQADDDTEVPTDG